MSDNEDSFDLEQLRPKANKWFETNFEYAGNGSAELTSPRGTVSGRFVAKFDENGGHAIETISPTLSPSDVDYEGDPTAMLFGSKPQRSGKTTSWGVGGMDNPCERLSFATTYGTFVSTGRVDGIGMTLSPDSIRLRFSARAGKFETNNVKPAKYFVMPLFNCVADPTNQLYFAHPLRIFPTPVIPPTVPAERRIIANITANQKNSVLCFFIKGRLCFIERVPEYENYLAELKSEAVQRKITAVLVGDIGDSPASNLADFMSWFPSGVFSALSFASGVQVGWPWIEIRDENGDVIRRLHGGARVPSFFAGDDVFGKFSRPGTGDFVTGFVKLPEEKQKYLQVAMNHARMGSLGSHMYLPDLLAHLVRALDGLCQENGFKQQLLTSGLSVEGLDKLNEITTETIARLEELKQQSKQSGNLDDYRLLVPITDRARSIGQTDNRLGLAAVELLKKFGFCDAQVLDRFLTSKGRRDWATLISAYRNATLHDGYIDFSNGEDFNEVIQICRHLKDVLTRIIFKECGYIGTYESVLRYGCGPLQMDWVRADTPASQLGFT
jgi:hypothetical protein